MLKSLIRSNVPDGEIDADSVTTNDYVGGCPAGLGSAGIYGTLSDTGYVGVLGNARGVDVANGKSMVYVGANKLKLWQGISGTDPVADTFCPFDVTVSWGVGDNLYIRSMTTYAVWSNHNYDSGVSRGLVTKAPATSADYMEAWFLMRS